ncbi:uncharacterized protein LOC123658900 [Melitaea cinxia]|uniref:uncharacterized protein LOC123658900 n=1 Tax=Melitaea cinxia TaxID=113334 RepID=UPI001E27211B|nr:uncharacterized protein LOC123658900 [Melitaea cinxia]
MVRHYKRKTTTKYDLETLKKAVDEVRTGKINSYQAARKYNIPRTTICDRVSGKRGVVKDTRGPPTVINTENELKLANGLRVMEKYGFGLTSKETLELVSIHVSENKYLTPFKNNQPGYDWFASFKKRHNLSLKKPQAVEMSRKVACDPFIVNEYFDILEEVLNELGLKGRPEKVWNLDESSFGNDPDKTKVVGARGFASTRTIASSGKDNVTILFTASAVGDKLPPLIINRGKNTWDQWMSELGYENTSYAATKNGWIDSIVFEKYMFNTVLPHLGEDPPALLIFDGHSTHIQLRILEEAQKRGVTIIKLPSHASHLLQPLDLSVFKSMKNTWDEKLVQWQRLNVGKRLPKDEFSRIIGEVWRELNPIIIRNGFKKGGIYPFNRHAVPEDKFDPESLKRFKHFKTSRKEIPTLKELTLQKVLHTINSSSQVPKMQTQITLNENNNVNIEGNLNDRNTPSTKKENKDPQCSKEAQLSDENEKAKRNTHINLSKKKKTGKKTKKRVKKQKKYIGYEEESEDESDISFDESDKSCEDLDRYREQYLAEMEDFDNFSLYAGNENETEDCFSKHDANIVDEFEQDVGRRNPEVHDWILVRFTTKKSVKYFVGNIISVNENNTPNVKFLRKIKNSRFMSFHYPDVEDISEIKHYDDIVMFLKKPDISRRGHVTFKENFKNYNIQ